MPKIRIKKNSILKRLETPVAYLHYCANEKLCCKRIFGFWLVHDMINTAVF